MPPKAEEPYWEDIRFKAYAKSNYTYDDAELLASLWNIDILDAKKTIGYKIMNKLEHLLPDKIKGGSGGSDGDWHGEDKVTPQDQLNAFFKSNYTYDDAELLAQLWNIDIVDAKKTIGNKIIYGWEKYLPDKIQGGSGGKVDPGKITGEDQLDAFFKSNYTYDDAEILASLWNIDIVEAKKTIGNKIIYGWEKYLPEKIQGGSGKYEGYEGKYDLEALGMFVLSPYTYEDADQLAQLWEIDVLDAKEIIGVKILNGDEKLLPDKIRYDDEEPGC